MTDKISVTKPIKDMNHDELLHRINSYHGTTYREAPEYDETKDWTKSPEYKEMKHRVDTWSVKRLEAEGYNIPARRR